MLLRQEAEGDRGEEGERGRFRDVEGRHVVGHFDAPIDHGIHVFLHRAPACRRDGTVTAEPPLGERADAIGDALRAAAGPLQISRPGRDHAPLDAPLRDGRSGHGAGGRRRGIRR